MGGLMRRDPVIDGDEDLAGSVQAPAGDLAAGAQPSPVRRACFLTWRTTAPAGAQGCATAQPTVSERAALTSGRGSLERIGPAGPPGATSGPPANAATVAGQEWPSWEPGGDQAAKVTRPIRRGFAQVTG
jgi:hypothetical protein